MLRALNYYYYCYNELTVNIMSHAETPLRMACNPTRLIVLKFIVM